MKECNDTIKVVKEYELKPGDKIVTRKVTENQSNSYKHHQELIEEIKEAIAEDKGAFIHLIYKYGTVMFKELEEKVPGNKNNIHIIRFMMLATCLTFGGKLFDDNRHRVKKSLLKNIWDTTSKNSINETYELLKECKYIYETEEGYIMINEEIVVKGAIKDFIKELKLEDGKYTYTRVFVDNLKDMYKGTEPKQRKQLANLFKALPYIHFKYNVFCSNPTETDEEKVNLLSWADLARLCGYEDKKNIARFKKDLMSLNISDHTVVGEFEARGVKMILVNPKIYYGGNNLNDVEDLQRLFDWADRIGK